MFFKIPFLSGLFAAFFAAPAFAKVDCIVIDQLARAQIALATIHNSLISDLQPDDYQTHLEVLQEITVDEIKQIFADHPESLDRSTMSALAKATEIVKHLVASDEIGAAYVYIHSSRVTEALDGANLRIRRYLCPNAATPIAIKATPIPAIADLDAGPVSQRRRETVEEPNFLITDRTQIIAAAMLPLLLVGAYFFIKWIKFLLLIRKRRSKRFPAQIVTSLNCMEGEHDVTVLDISCHGVKVQAPRSLLEAELKTATLLLNDQWFSAQIVWSNKFYLGLTFDRPLSINFVRDLVGARKSKRRFPRRKKAAPGVAPPQ